MAMRIAHESAADEHRESIQFIFNHLAQDNIISALDESNNLYLALSLQTAANTCILRFLPLGRTPAADTAAPAAAPTDLIHFTVPRPSVRRFASAMIRDAGSWASGTLRASVMMRVGYGEDDASVMLPVAHITEIDLPMASILQEGDVPDMQSRVSMQVVSIGPAELDGSTSYITDLSNVHAVDTNTDQATDNTEALVQSLINPTITGLPASTTAEPLVERLQSSFANVVVYHSVECRMVTVSSPCLNAEGCMDLHFLQVPDVVANTLLSISVSISPDVILQSVSGYFSDGVIVGNELYS